ncbi:MAG: DUF1768 domain-containing protein [Lachnospiraceae bacterium]|nr:DUF1768 domain-containing protein [Lachnospiraceae bacterium]
MSTIRIQKIGITKLPADAVVNAANSNLQKGDGVCGTIFTEAGAEEMQRACDAIGGCKTGQAVLTEGFHLRAKYVIHAVGPFWCGGGKGEPEQLYSCYQAALKLAAEQNCRSVALPLISSGRYGYPVREAWEVAIRSCADWLLAHKDCQMDLTFATMSDEVQSLGQAVLDASGHSEMDSDGNFVFFWLDTGENGYLSQWYEAPFTLEGIRYRFAEQYCIAKKALLFHDLEMYCLIMNETDPGKSKLFGGNVRNFDAGLWDDCREEIAYRANLAKFRQNEALRQRLLATGERILAHASPYDKAWGIGLEESEGASLNPALWQGENLLGKVLMRVRRTLAEEADGQ